MHHYWRAMDDSKFPVPSSPEEKIKYGEAVEYGYDLCDELLGRFLRLVDDNTVVVVASSMGQQPYVHELFPEGKIAVRFKDPSKILAIVGARGVTEIVPTMLPQYNVTIPEAAERARVRDLLRAGRCQGGIHPDAIHVEETGNILTLTPRGLSRRSGEQDVRYTFPGAPFAKSEGYALEELFATDAPTPKEGMHDPRGMVIFHGPGIRRGTQIENISPLDLLPTMLNMLDVPVPGALKGRVLSEIWQSEPTAAGATRAA
jgi:arylsulfatase A-like enzyme